jgi:hypothetical protein
LSQAGGHGEQAAAAERTLAGLHAMADLPLDHRRAQCSLGGIIGGFDALDFQEGPERFLIEVLVRDHIAKISPSLLTSWRSPLTR